MVKRLGRTERGAKTVWKQIKEACDVTEEHIAEAVDMRDGLYGGERLGWDEIINRIEAEDEDWGDSMESEAIRYLRREVNRRIRENA